MMKKKLKNWLKPWHMGTHRKVLSMSYLMNTTWQGLNVCVLELWTKVASALEWYSQTQKLLWPILRLFRSSFYWWEGVTLCMDGLIWWVYLLWKGGFFRNNLIPFSRFIHLGKSVYYFSVLIIANGYLRVLCIQDLGHSDCDLGYCSIFIW